MLDRIFSAFAHGVSSKTGQPATFILALSIVVIWGITGPLFHWSDTWQLVINTGTTIITFLMVFVIQNAQNVDASAIQAKLDELIRANGKARNEFIGIEHMTASQLEQIRAKLEELSIDEHGIHKPIEQVIQRR